MIDLLEWSREVINSLMRKKNDSAYLYQMEIVLNPNPLNYDGIDEIIINIIEINQRTKTKTLFYSTKNDEYCSDLERTQELINKLVTL